MMLTSCIIQLGPEHRLYLQGKKRFMMDFRNETPKVAKTKPKTKGAQAAAAKKKGAVLRNNSNQDVFAPDFWDSDEEFQDAIEESPPANTGTAKRVFPKRALSGAAGTTGTGLSTPQSK